MLQPCILVRFIEPPSESSVQNKLERAFASAHLEGHLLEKSAHHELSLFRAKRERMSVPDKISRVRRPSDRRNPTARQGRRARTPTSGRSTGAN